MWLGDGIGDDVNRFCRHCFVGVDVGFNLLLIVLLFDSVVCRWIRGTMVIFDCRRSLNGVFDRIGFELFVIDVEVGVD